MESWSNNIYTYPKRVSECEREKEKCTKNIERDQDRNRGINKREERQEGEKAGKKGGGSNMLKILKVLM